MDSGRFGSKHSNEAWVRHCLKALHVSTWQGLLQGSLFHTGTTLFCIVLTAAVRCCCCGCCAVCHGCVLWLCPTVLQEVRSADTVGPVLVHVITEKGRGYLPAETAQVRTTHWEEELCANMLA